MSLWAIINVTSVIKGWSGVFIMKKLSYLMLVFISLGLFACSAPQELMVLIDRDRADEAWIKAYNTGGTLGYERGFHDDENKVVEYSKIDMDSGLLPTNLHIKMELDISDDAVVLWLHGIDKDIARDDDQVLSDMQKIVKRVELCCAVAEEDDLAVSLN